MQVSGISRTESEKHEKRAIGSVDVPPCWSTFFGIVPFLHHHLWWDFVTWQIPTIIITDKNPPWWEFVMVGICWVTGPDPGIVEVQKAREECAPLSLGGDQILVRASKYPEQLPGLAPHCLPYLCPLLSSHFEMLLQDEVYQVVECSKCSRAADEQPRRDCIRTMRPRLGDLHP